MPYITVGSDWLKGGFLTCLPPLRLIGGIGIIGTEFE